uniref:Uncharacterized protein n=1 Tax=Ficedula albicollis TaxID=59894 RepID=A0A803VNH0_FICAL
GTPRGWGARRRSPRGCRNRGGRADLPQPGRSRPYAVLQHQNLVLLGSILSALLLTIILMAICVYRPVRRR